MGCLSAKTNSQIIKRTQTEEVMIRKMSINTRTIIKELDNIPQTYSFKKVLGHGKFGRVLLWESRDTNHQYAIKAITKGEGLFSRMIEEVNILSKVDHPNIIKYIKSFQSKKYLYVVMEYCHGGNLFEKTLEKGKFGELEAMNIMQEILRAINHCHHLGIIHRDLKPENIMYSDEGILKIIDFGLSMWENSYTFDTMAGTKYYIAPEVLNTSTFTKACDIWSLGVILHIILSGYVPIVGSKAEDIFRNIMEYTGPKFTGEIWNSISKEAKDLVAKMMDPNYKTRISAADALEHPWFKLKKEELPPEIPKILISLKRYSESSKLKRKLLNILFKEVNDIDLAEFKKAFLMLDKENTGLITCRDLEIYLKETGRNATAQEIEAFTRKINKNGEAYINYSEFIAAAMATKQFLTDEKLEHLFKVLDVKNQGVIVPGGIQSELDNNKVFQAVSPIRKVTDPEVDMQGKMTFEEFKCILLS